MSVLSAPTELTCRSCRAPIVWGKTWAPRDEWVPLDAEPDEHGQWVLLRTGPKVMPIRPEALSYPPEVQARRHYDHRTTCALGPSIRTFAGIRRDVDRGVAEDLSREEKRARRLELDRIREMYPWPHR